MSTGPVQLTVTIMGREYRVSCTEDEREELLEAVAFLDGRMREIRDSGRVAGAERIAVMAALNIAHELLKTKVAGPFDVGELKRRIQGMQAVVDAALKQQEALF